MSKNDDVIINKIIKIEVSGKENIGKSSVIEYIRDCLWDCGFNVKIKKNENINNSYSKVGLNERLRQMAYRNDLMIEIEEKSDMKHNDGDSIGL